jgi:hypothetical protein
VQKSGKKSVGLLELETAVLECFLEKTPLSPLGVKEIELLLNLISLKFSTSMQLSSRACSHVSGIIPTI